MRALCRRWLLLLALAACDAPDTGPEIPIDLPEHFEVPEGADLVEMEVSEIGDSMGCRSWWDLQDDGTPIAHVVLPIEADIEAQAMDLGGAFFLEKVSFLLAERPTAEVLYVFCEGRTFTGYLRVQQAWSLRDTLTIDTYFERGSGRVDDLEFYEGDSSSLYVIDTEASYSNYDARYLGDFEGDGQ